MALDKPRRAVPHIREFLADSLTPLAVYRRLAEISPVRFLLESVTGGEKVSRFSFLGAGPREIYRLYEDGLEVERAGKRRRLEGGPLEALHQVIHGIVADPSPIPFTGGLVGYFGYESVRHIEPTALGALQPDILGTPDMLLLVSDELAVVDNVQGKLYLVVYADPRQANALAKARERLQSLRARLAVPLAEEALLEAGVVVTGGEVRRSVLSPAVRVEQGAVVEDSVLMDHVLIGEGAVVRNTILDKAVRVPPGAKIGVDAELDAQRGFMVEDGLTVLGKGQPFPD